MRVASLSFALLLLAGSGAHAQGQNRTVRVPQDARTLDAAISRVAAGGTIELSAGTYRPTGDGFAISNTRKGFTVRAAAGATVVLDGGGARALVRLVNSRRDRGKRVTFERIAFQNGFSTALNQAGAVTVSQAEAVFRDCSFTGNRSAGTNAGGGAVKVIEGSAATFINSSFRDNSSPNRGGALSVRSSEATIQGGELVNNRTNVPGHKVNASGGAIMVLDGKLRVTGARFEGNQAGWVGGAIYAFGTWSKGSEVVVANSTFVENQALADPCCANPDPTTGGALHAEDLTTLRVHRSLFVRNRADTAGGVRNYRAVTDIHGSVFQGNQSTSVHPEGAGGAIGAGSVDFPDNSTEFGAVNRRTARLVVTRSLFHGGSAVARAPKSGGCILAGGDGFRVYGTGPVPPAGTLEENRARVEIRHTVFSDCDVETGSDGGGGLGGAFSGDLVDLVMEDSMVLDSDARGANGGGGAIALRLESNARIVRTTFARNSAQKWGGALFLSGSTVQVDDSRFYANSVGESRGSAIYAIPLIDAARPRNARGVVANSSFSENVGVPLWDVDPANGPINEMRYDNNRFNSSGSVYVNNLAAPGGVDVSGLNVLTVFRPGRGDTPKSAVPNTRVFGLREAVVRAVPAPGSVGAGAPAPGASLLAYAWTGGSSATIGAQGLPARAGLLEAPPGDYFLSVDRTAVASTRALGSCTAGPYLCLNGNRFRAEVTWKNGGVAAPAQAVSVSGDTGYFWFLGPENVELMVKVLDGRGINNNFWVYYGGLTNLEYTLEITDTVTGVVKTYRNHAGRFASAGDVGAFPSTARAAAGIASAGESLEACAGPGCGKALALSNGRFSLEVTWKNAAGQTQTAQAVPLTSDTGYFWFGSADNVEVIVKVLDGRGLNGHFWVYYGALTDQEYTLTVRDTVTNRSKTYRNPKGRFASAGDGVAIPGN
ncbi:MAG TPA: right-handed parallel beta-helix repeat-containing protein [Thermoanaerobaculia bacterium]|nr:right-handed parallel beta-helix repeat-containing protein [Thermoanaerobaculia bacterium]